MSSYAFPISFTNFCLRAGSSDRKSRKSTLGIFCIVKNYLFFNSDIELNSYLYKYKKLFIFNVELLKRNYVRIELV